MLKLYPFFSFAWLAIGVSTSVEQFEKGESGRVSKEALDLSKSDISTLTTSSLTGIGRVLE